MLARYKSHIAFFLFVAFLLIRVVNVHAFSHNEDDKSEKEHCELCVIIHHSEKDTKLLADFPTLSETPKTIFIDTAEKNIGYFEPLHQFASPLIFHNKPPPAFLIV